MVVLMTRVLVMAFLLVASLAPRAGAQVQAPFWEQIRDSTLDALIVEARRANTDVRVAQERLNATRASRRLASFDLLPTVTAVGSTMRQQQSLALMPGLTRQAPQQQLWDIGFDASWE